MLISTWFDNYFNGLLFQHCLFIHISTLFWRPGSLMCHSCCIEWWLACTWNAAHGERPCGAVEWGWVMCSARSWIIKLWSWQRRVQCALAVQRVLDCGSLLCPSTPDERFNAPNRPWYYYPPHYGNTQKILGWRTAVFERWIRWFGSKKTAGAALQAAGTTRWQRWENVSVICNLSTICLLSIC